MPPRPASLPFPISPLHPSLPSAHFFSTTAPPRARSSASRLEHIHRRIAPYPYGPSPTYKQSNFGLYGGSHIRFGNTVSEHNNKSRRTWKPNIHRKRLWSAALGEHVRVRVQARVLRTIDKVGGLDEYLLGDKPARVKELGMGGWRLRWKLMGTEAVRERYRRERERLGVPTKRELRTERAREKVRDQEKVVVLKRMVKRMEKAMRTPRLRRAVIGGPGGEKEEKGLLEHESIDGQSTTVDPRAVV